MFSYISKFQVVISTSFILSIMSISLTYLTTPCHVIYIFSYNCSSAQVFVNSVLSVDCR